MEDVLGAVMGNAFMSDEGAEAEHISKRVPIQDDAGRYVGLESASGRENRPSQANPGMSRPRQQTAVKASWCESYQSLK